MDIEITDEMQENVKKHFLNKKKHIENGYKKQESGRLLQR